MDPYLEHPALWPDVHNSLIAAIRDAISPRITPRYYVAGEPGLHDDARRCRLVGRSDIAVIPRPPFSTKEPGESSVEAGVAVLDVDVPMADHVNETYLEVREAHTGIVVTILEILSPANKIHSEGRKQYESKRMRIFELQDEPHRDRPAPRRSAAGRGRGEGDGTDYRILVSRSWERPKAKLYAFGVRAAIPTFPLAASGRRGRGPRRP